MAWYINVYNGVHGTWSESLHKSTASYIIMHHLYTHFITLAPFCVLVPYVIESRKSELIQKMVNLGRFLDVLGFDEFIEISTDFL